MNYENKEEGLIASCPKCKGKRKMLRYTKDA